MMPAFSPGPWTTNLLRVGSRRRCTRDDLYEQCSLHITLKTPSSVYVGVRPSDFSTRAYSSGVSLCCFTTSGVMGRSPGNETDSFEDMLIAALVSLAGLGA